MSQQQEITNGVEIYRRLLGYVKPYKAAFFIAILGMVLAAATDTGLAALMQPMLDGGFVDNDPFWIKIIPLLLIVLALFRGLGAFLSSYLMGWVGRHVIKAMRQGIFEKFLTLPARFFDHNASGQLLSKMSYDVEQVAQASTQAITVLVRDSLTVVGLLGWMFYLNWKLSLLFLIIGPIIGISIALVNRRFRRISTNIQNTMGDVTDITEEVVEGHQIIKTFGGAEYEQQRFSKVNDRNRLQNMKLIATSEASRQFVQLIAAFSLALVVYLATLAPMLEQVTVGIFMSFIVAMMMLSSPIKRLTTINAMIQRGIAAANSIFLLLDSEVEKDTGTKILARAEGHIEFKNITFSYDRAKGNVLCDVSLKIHPGQTVAFVGRSGSGKTTLMSLLPRFYDLEPDLNSDTTSAQTTGQILLDGHNINQLSLKNLRAQIAIVGQNVTLFNDSVANNIAYGDDEGATREAIVAAAKAAHALEFIERLPQGFDTPIGENGVLLSGGQRQRIAIARALYKDAPILILDEATSALDSESERHIQAALETLMENRTTLVIAHRLSTIEKADQIAVMKDGAILEVGRHEELLSTQGIYSDLYRMQFSDQPATSSNSSKP